MRVPCPVGHSSCYFPRSTLPPVALHRHRCLQLELLAHPGAPRLPLPDTGQHVLLAPDGPGVRRHLPLRRVAHPAQAPVRERRQRRRKWGGEGQPPAGGHRQDCGERTGGGVSVHVRWPSRHVSLSVFSPPRPAGEQEQRRQHQHGSP